MHGKALRLVTSNPVRWCLLHLKICVQPSSHRSRPIELSRRFGSGSNPVPAEFCWVITQILCSSILRPDLSLPTLKCPWLSVFGLFPSVLIAIPVTIIKWLECRIQLLIPLYTLTLTLSSPLCIILVVMTRSAEFKTSRCVLMLILWFSLPFSTEWSGAWLPINLSINHLIDGVFLSF